MLTFRTASIFFIIALCGVLLLHYYSVISWWWALPVFLLYASSLVYGSASIHSDFYTTVHCQGNTVEKEIALSFDDGPSPFTALILQTLANYNAPATFFVIGKHIKGNETILKQAVSEGHLIGNHTFTHSFFIDFKNARGFEKELKQTSDAVYHVTGKRMKFFRPPYGVTTPHLVKAAKKSGYHIIGWNIRSLDTTNDSEDVVFKRVSEQLKPGSILLFHDTSEKTNAVLKRTLAFAKENHFRIVSLERLLQLPAYQNTPAT